MKATKVRFGNHVCTMEKICARMEWAEVDQLERLITHALSDQQQHKNGWFNPTWSEMLDQLRGLQQEMIELQMENARCAR